MLITYLLARLVRWLFPVCIAANVYLYLYPVFLGCSFPKPTTNVSPDCEANGLAEKCTLPSPVNIAPFRLLALGDPQLEGDSSLPNPDDPIFPSLQNLRTDLSKGGYSGLLDTLRRAGSTLVLEDIPRILYSVRKRLDLFGNDFYLAHIYRTLRWWTQPSHIAVLGDLLGSQWVSDEEFHRRGWRYWNRVFRGAEKVPDEVMDKPHVETLGADAAWSKRIINIAGNHDIGYAGDISEMRISRFEQLFGKVNWEITFEMSRDAMPETSNSTSSDTLPSLRLIILNSMNLDTPALSEALQGDTYNFLNDVIARSHPVEEHTTAVILLTHIPLYKEAGICVDGPFFNFFGHYVAEGILPYGLREQNHLSDYASKTILQGIFGKNSNKNAPGGGYGRDGLVINGHDHEGCDVLHFVRQQDDNEDWEAVKWADRRQNLTTTNEQHIPTNEDEAANLLVSGEDKDTTKLDDTCSPIIFAIENATSTESMYSLPTSSLSDSPPNFHSSPPTSFPNTHEITLRSMMGEYGGYAGLLSAWWSPSAGRWQFEFQYCALGTQHWWWAVHIFDLIYFGSLLTVLGLTIWEGAVKNKNRSLSTEKGRVIKDHGRLSVQNTGQEKDTRY